MKMETEVTARRSGKITIKVQPGAQVQTGQVLAEIN
jgi:biotin carboxyl carrier protein